MGTPKPPSLAETFPDDTVEACDEDGLSTDDDNTPDDHVDAVVLFANGDDPETWTELFGGA